MVPKPSSVATVFRDVRPRGGPPADLIAVDGVLVAADAVPEGTVVEYVDGACRLALPTLSTRTSIGWPRTAARTSWACRAPISAGSPADFMLVDGECVAQVVVDQPRRELVVRAGRVVAEDGRLR